ncbi:pilus assembly protein [Gemmobacter straminiformis]|uniref:Pilus assembly protein n=1 Tax=Paragemmobacter straminiformis TaxID=2045119 RepID=A0A842ICY5_9RHOB|nr:pilus assembly protein [Gemmobacter straminiformis]
MKRLTAPLISRFRTSEQGAILVEALIAIPIITIFAVGLLEFGVMFWERQQMQAGVRDAARYWSRCSQTAAAAGSCSLTKARNIAFYSNPAGTGGLRVPNWYRPEDLAISPTTPPANTAPTDIVYAEGRLLYSGSPLFGLLDIGAVTVRYNYSMRYLGW